MHRMPVRGLVIAMVGALLALPVAAGAHEGADDSPDLPNPLIEKLAHLPRPAERPAAAAAAPPVPLPPMPGGFELVGHEPLRNRGMNSALAVHGHYVYVGNRTDGTHSDGGVMVVDVADPSAPRIVGEIGPPDEGNPGESSRELRILPQQGLLMVLNHGCSEAIHRCASAATTVGFAPTDSNIRFYDITGANAAAPKLVSEYLAPRNQPQIPHEFVVWNDPQRPGRTLMFWTAPSSAEEGGRPNLYVTDISGAREGRFVELAEWSTVIVNEERDNRLHSLTLSPDGRRAHLAFLGGGFLVADTSDFADAAAAPQVRLVTPVENRVFWTDPGAHSAIKVPGRDYALVTDEVYGRLGGVLAAHGCPWGWVRMIDIAQPERPRIAAEYKLPVNDPAFCESVSEERNNFTSLSAHNPTLTRNLAFLTWHSAGLQAIDISDPAQPRPAGAYMPEPLPSVQTEDPALSSGEDKVVMWSFPVIKDGLIYVIDLRNGLYILRYRGPYEDEVARVGFLDGNSNSGDAARLEEPDPAPTAAPAATPAATPPARRRCLSRRPRSLRRGLTRGQVIRRVGRPARRAPRLYRYCIAGGGSVTVAFSRRYRVRLVRIHR